MTAPGPRRPVGDVTSARTTLPYVLLGCCLPLAAAALLGVLGLLATPPLPVPPPAWTAATTAAALLCALTALLLVCSDRDTGTALPEQPEPSSVSHDARVTAHELRSALALPLAHLDTALDPDRAPEQAREDVERAAHAIERADSLIGHLLLDAPATPARTTDVDLYALAVATVTDFTPLARRRGLAVSLSSAPDATSTVEGDPRALRQLLDNLLSNAVKYAEAGSWIDVALTSGPEHVHLAVTNAGTSASADEDDALFESTSRGSGAPQQAEGEGMGLWVVRAVARSHGGEATLNSDEVTGTTRINVDFARFHPRFHPGPAAGE